jgi:hypothetical protein
MAVLVAARFKEWVCGCSLAGIASSNPGGEWIYISVTVVFYQVAVFLTDR